MAEHWKKERLCPVCGNTFKGTEKALVCGATCRSRLKRIVDSGKKPEFYFIAKGKGQKVPLLLAEKALKRKTAKATPQEKVIEPVLPPPPLKEEKTLTREEIWANNDTINQQIKTEQKRQLPAGMHPRVFKLKQNDIIAELQKLLK